MVIKETREIIEGTGEIIERVEEGIKEFDKMIREVEKLIGEAQESIKVFIETVESNDEKEISITTIEKLKEIHEKLEKLISENKEELKP